MGEFWVVLGWDTNWLGWGSVVRISVPRRDGTQGEHMPVLNTLAYLPENLLPGNETMSQYRQADPGHQQSIRHGNISRDISSQYQNKRKRIFTIMYEFMRMMQAMLSFNNSIDSIEKKSTL
jgi:hypothetical protein